MVQTHRIKTIAIAGCTAVGKSETALRLADKFNGVLIGADSMQIYRGFDIGTGKLSEAECGGIEHRMINIVDGGDDFSVGDYVERADADIREVAARGKLPIVVGGTGLYINSLFSGCNFADAPKNDAIRKSLKISSHFFGGKVLHALLANIDDRSADKISENDVKRTVRALEIYAVRGVAKSEAVSVEKPYDDLTVVLTLPRELLYERINARVHKMFDMGLIEDVLGLKQYEKSGAMQALGYKQIIANPEMSRIELEQTVAQKTRNYAKRQMTYFNNVKLNKVFIDARDYAAVEKTVEEFINRGEQFK